MRVLQTIGGLEVVDDVSPADPVASRMRAPLGLMRSLVPDGYPAYARVLHPAYALDSHGEWSTPVRWSQIAADNGARAHRLMQWQFIAGDTDCQEPSTGTMTRDHAARLIDVLQRHVNPDKPCWFGFWNGYHPTVIEAGTPTFHVPGREMHLLRGPVGGLAVNLAAEPFLRLPNLCWSDDRRWVVATDIDLDSTYIAGDRAIIDDLLSARALEVWEMQPDDLITLASGAP